MNDIKWQKFVKSSTKDETPLKFVECIRKFLTESKINENCDDILYEIDLILEQMSEEQQDEAQTMLKQMFNETEPYQKIMQKEHPRWKMRLIGYGKNKDKSSPYKTKPSMKRSKSAPPGE